MSGTRPSRLAIAAAATALAGLLLTTGCLTPDQMVALQKDVSDIRAQMEALRKENQDNAARMEEVRKSVEARQEESRTQAAETKRQTSEMRDDVRAIGTRIDELQQRLNTSSLPSSGGAPRSAGGAAPPPAAGPGPAGAAPPTSAGGSGAGADRPAGGAPDEIFNQAYADYSKGNYAPAELGFEEFLKRFPTSDRADDALYWIGLCHYDQGEYEEAIRSFDRLIQEYPSGDKVAGARLKKGLALLSMNRTAQGVVQLESLIDQFPKSEEARIAGDRLREIGVKPGTKPAGRP